MHIGFYDGLIFLTGVPGRTKSHVATESVMDISTAILILDVLNIVWVWRLLGSIFIFSSSLSMKESSLISAVGAVLLFCD